MNFDFIVEGKNFTIKVEVEKPNLVHTYKYRPEERYKNGAMTILNRIEIFEFKQDVQFLLDQLRKVLPSQTDQIKYALTEIIKKHIGQYKRLIINDLYTFLDEMLIVLEHVELTKGKLLPVSQGNRIWESYNELLMDIFKTQIWVPAQGGQGLMKLTDYLLSL